MNSDWLQNLVAIAVVALVVTMFVRGRLRQRPDQTGCGSGACGSCGSAEKACGRKAG